MMKKYLLLIILTFLSFGDNIEAGDTCSDNKDPITCGTKEGCVWCKSKAVPSACLQTIHATSLPTSVFFCDFKNEEGLEKIALLKGEIYSSMHVIPFTPKTHIAISYGPSIIVLGKSYDKGLVKAMPTIDFYPHAKGFFSIFLIDPDAPNPSFIHFLQVNIEGEKDIKSSINANNFMKDGNNLISYFPPNPPSGVHRYIVLIAHQTAGKIALSEFSKLSRASFDVATFSTLHKMEGVGLTYFTIAA